MDIKNKVVVVTGGGGVLCSDFAIELAKHGAKIAILDLNEQAAQKAANTIKDNGGIAIAVPTNVLDKESLVNANKMVESKLGICDILINGAGGNNPKGTTDEEQFNIENINKEDVRTFFDLDPDGIKFVFDLNFIGTLLPTQVFAKNMVQKKSSTIINISSMNAFKPLTKIPAYSGAKAAISNFTQWLAVYFAKSGIRVNAIAPGFFVTNQNRNLLFDENNNPTPRTDKILSATPMGRFGESNELLGTLLWLVDEKASSFVTGVVVPVDGGFSAYSGV